MDHLRVTGDGPVPVELPASSWLRQIRNPDTARAALVLLPHAGGGAHAYVGWAPVLPADVAVLAVEYPGHGARMGEAPVADLGTIVTGLADVLARFHDALGGRPLVLGGHSLGALLAHEVAGELQRGGRSVRGLFLSGAVPPHRRVGMPDLSRLDDETLAAELGASGDIPRQILDDVEARALYLPLVRHDLALAHRFCYLDRAGRPAVRSRAVVVGGLDDDRCPAGDLSGWADLIEGPVEVTVLPGGHFYHRQQLDVVGRLIGDLVGALSPVHPAPSPSHS